MSLSRRKFLIGSSLLGGGLILGLNLKGKNPIPNSLDGSFQPNAWLQITTDGQVIFQLHKVEMGQGVMTALPTILGEELDFEPKKFKIEMAGVHGGFNDPETRNQMTGGSTSIANSWQSLREAGAMARAMLVQAAAKQWGISIEQCRTDNGLVINQNNNQQLSYASLADAANQIGSVDYTLKSAKDYRWIGKSLPRLDSVEKSTGKAIFGLDVSIPNQKTAVVIRPPNFGGSIESWDKASVINENGVIAAFSIHSGIAIVADSYWQARKASEKLLVQFNSGPVANIDSATILQRQQQAFVEGEAYNVIDRGDPQTTFKSAAISLEAEYASPFTHHSPMEPQNATALVTKDSCEVWAPNQAPDICRAMAAHFSNIPRNQVTVNSTLLGGGFGRRGYPDFVGEVVAIAAQQPGIPIKLIWSREDDMRHDYYRPATYHGLQGGLDQDNKLIGWQHKLVSNSIVQGLGVDLFAAILPAWVPTDLARSMGRFIGDTAAEYDPTTADGAYIPYQVDNITIGQIYYDSGVPTGFWRSVGYSHNCFAVESFFDELAHAANIDPYKFRMNHIDRSSRLARVLKLATEKANWGNPAPGLSQGLALVEPFNSFCSMVVEVAVKGTEFSIERIVTAVDCGFAVNPAIIKTQVESSIIYGLTAAIKAPVTIANGAVVENNFHDLPVLRINETPKMEVHIVDSAERPTGIGEIAVPAVAPALANALFAATGQRLRTMPLTLS
jgi:isoquinoline 1-oxidoreductase/isoquinoline 1-oxidoreductase beta subunit